MSAAGTSPCCACLGEREKIVAWLLSLPGLGYHAHLLAEWIERGDHLRADRGRAGEVQR